MTVHLPAEHGGEHGKLGGLWFESFEFAAELSNLCKARGIQGSVVDLLICSVAISREWSIFTEDADFLQYKRVIPIHLHPRPRLH